MPLRHRLQADRETVQDLEIASEQRYWEGLELLVSGYRGAGIYLLGYAAEMILKQVCFIVDGARPFDDVASRLAPVASWARRHLPGLGHEHYHSLRFWAAVLQVKRRLRGRPLAAPLQARLMQRTNRVFGIWTVAMRYRPDQSLPREARAVYDDVTWLRTHRYEFGF